MAIVSAEKFVQAARDNGYAVGGFNTNNLETHKIQKKREYQDSLFSYVFLLCGKRDLNPHDLKRSQDP